MVAVSSGKLCVHVMHNNSRLIMCALVCVVTCVRVSFQAVFYNKIHVVEFLLQHDIDIDVHGERGARGKKMMNSDLVGGDIGREQREGQFFITLTMEEGAEEKKASKKLLPRVTCGCTNAHSYATN